MNGKYGFSFVRSNPGGIGAALHAQMFAMGYAERNGYEFGITDPNFNFLNGYDPNCQESKTWIDYFDVPVIEDTIGVWPDTPKGHFQEPPSSWKGTTFEWYSHLIKKIFVLKPDIQTEVEEMIQKSGFLQSDALIHIRRTDKIKTESKEIPLNRYVEACKEILPPGSRILLCSDDFEARDQVSIILKREGFDPYWDTNERVTMHAKRVNGGISFLDAWRDNLETLKTLIMMSRASYLIGARASYFYRIGELLNTNVKNSRNLGDNDMFGLAPYDSDKLDQDKLKMIDILKSTTPEQIVSAIVKLSKEVQLSKEAQPSDNFMTSPLYSKFLRTFDNDEISKYSQTLLYNHLVTIPLCISDSAKAEILQDIPNFGSDWWFHSIKKENQSPTYFKPNQISKIKAASKLARKNILRGFFCYHFMRTKGGHVGGCICFSCRMETTMRNSEMTTFLSKIVGSEVCSFGETFTSNYSKGHFLTKHHDKNKGDYTFILSLTEGWKDIYGGLTHFVNSEGQIHKTLIPTFGNLTIFKIDPNHQMDHFVSEVSIDKERITHTGWFNIKKN